MVKFLIVVLLAAAVFGGAGYFAYNIFVKPEQAFRAEQAGPKAKAEPTPDVSLPEFQAAAKLKTDGKLAEARAALTTFLAKYPSGGHVEEARDLLGDLNMDVLLSSQASPEKQEYIVRSGDVLARIAAKLKTTPELIMRTNGLDGTMLHIGERLLISHPQFSLLIQRKAKVVVLLNHGTFFKQYHVHALKLPGKQPPKIQTHVAETMAWRDGKRVGFGTRDYVGSTRWIRIAAPNHVLYSEADPNHRKDVAPPPAGFGLAAGDVEELSTLVNSKTPVTITD